MYTSWLDNVTCVTHLMHLLRVSYCLQACCIPSEVCISAPSKVDSLRTVFARSLGSFIWGSRSVLVRAVYVQVQPIGACMGE